MSRAHARLLLALVAAYSGFVLTIQLLAQDSPKKDGEVIYEIHDVGDYGITGLKGISMPQPEFTDEARRKKINRNVVLSIVVGTDGKVRDAEVKKGLDKGLDKESVKTVKTWTFQPAVKDGQSVPVRIDVEVTFRVR